MKIAIDNLDGLGALEYEEWVSSVGPVKVQRTLNAPSTCECVLDLNSANLRVPMRKGRVIVTRDDQTVVFTGYIATEPELIFAGTGVTGTAYRVAVRAISDEWLLDRQDVSQAGFGFQESGAGALNKLTSRTGVGGFQVADLGTGRSIGVFEPEQNRSWSANAGALAGSICSAYRVVGGVVGLQPAGAVTHLLSDIDGSLQIEGLRMAQRKELANDITVSGEMEAATYMSESFAGDGSTGVFNLTKTPFRYGVSSGASQLIADSFDQEAFDNRTWIVSDPGSHFSFTAAGLCFSGGNGLDGHTTLQAIDAVEIGGNLVLEMGAVRVEGASDGVLCGLYSGSASRGSCFAGYNLRQSGGSTVVVPLVNGTEAGTAYVLQSGHSYTLRVLVHCVEMQRLRQIYYAMVDGAVRSFGGGVLDAPVDLVFDLQDLGASSNTPATILYDGTLQSSPSICSFVPVNSVQLVGSVGYCRGTQTGPAWVTKTSATGLRSTVIVGPAGEGLDCTISVSGRVTFSAGRVPQAGELITVRYRSGQRAIARLQDAENVARETGNGVSGIAQWRGRVLHPLARSTEDCENAAAALLSVASDPTGAMSGTYSAISGPDVWPGDVLSVSREGETVKMVARTATIQDGSAVPEYVTYHVTFANEWAEAMAIKVSDAVATDIMLPRVAEESAAQSVPSLQLLSLVSATSNALQLDAGTAPPAGGGFEVRRRDGGFGAGVDQDLVLRSPVRGFSIPRSAQVEGFYVRMYDGSTPPLYSRISSSILTDIPVG